jgi:glycosyltransferase involved in cell wall biosynthesis
MPEPLPSSANLPATPREEGSLDRASAERLDVTVVVPVQSPEAEIEDVAAALSAELEHSGKSYEILYVFDGVTGVAWKSAQALLKRSGSRVGTISFKNAFGESVCLSAAVERARGRYIVTSPQYVQVDPHELRAMLSALDAGADFVTPWRHPRVDPLLNQLQSTIFNALIRLIIRGPFHDLNCYFRAIRREVLEDVAIYGDMYRFLPVIAFRQGYKIQEVKVRHLKEWGAAGFFGLGVYARRALDVLAVMFLTKFTLKPLRFFGTVGGLFVLSGLAVGGFLAWRKYWHHEPVADQPLFFVGVMLCVLGVQIVGFGLVGEIIIFSQARNLREYRVERIWE